MGFRRTFTAVCMIAFVWQTPSQFYSSTTYFAGYETCHRSFRLKYLPSTIIGHSSITFSLPHDYDEGLTFELIIAVDCRCQGLRQLTSFSFKQFSVGTTYS